MDASWASDKAPGGVAMFGDHWIKSWSKTQSLIALSLVEFESDASVKATPEVMAIKPMLRDFSRHMSLKAMANASAVVGIMVRRGLGKVRHLDANHLLIQEAAAKKRAKFEKSLRIANPTDVMTKKQDKPLYRSTWSLSAHDILQVELNGHRRRQLTRWQCICKKLNQETHRGW